MRIDKWLFFARIFKTRNRAIKAIEKNYIFLNGDVVKKQAQIVKIGDRIIIKSSKELLQIIIHFLRHFWLPVQNIIIMLQFLYSTSI